jgi:ribose transport system substrate-binding protein
MDRSLSRRRAIRLAVAGTTVFVAGPHFVGRVAAAPPPLEKKDKYTVGFPQIVEDNPWRIAQSQSMKDEAAARGHELIFSVANNSEATQIANVRQLISQQVDMIFLPPLSEEPLARAVLDAKAAGIPLLCVDRDVSHDIATPGEDYLGFIGSDFYQEGARAAEWLARTMSGEAQIIQLEGTSGSSPAMERGRGFADYLAGTYEHKEVNTVGVGTPSAAPTGGFPGMSIVASQDGDFNRDKGREVFEALYDANPDANAVYGHNDEMAIGAINALEARGEVPGTDVILVSIDGNKDALQAIIDGKLGASVECNPRFGPAAFDILERYANGEEIPTVIINPDRFFDATNAEEFVDEAY